ncbi:MAG: hypothetical protein HeimC2_31860 [Candidatus Heimdallarchaeota archaeon LC_2]|nr:MAG: hypothetical protein HeimC2_31860 [Candidatus Heimdallarchaeota archaeon LC_2]
MRYDDHPEEHGIGSKEYWLHDEIGTTATGAIDE